MALDQQDALYNFHSLLVREFGSRHPWDLRAPLTVADICHNLVPFEVRGEELGLESLSEYEDTLLRLLNGEGGYLRLDSDFELQKIQHHLDTSSPRTGVHREFLNSGVRLNPVVGERPVRVAEKPTRVEPTVGETGDLQPNKDCPSCREPLPQQAGVKFCPFCGDDVQRILCGSCNQQLRLNWRFCIACGGAVESESSH